MSIKLQFAANDNILDGWINFRNEKEADISKPLAFKNDSVDFIFIEHGLEHVTPQQGYKFLLEAHRILKACGVIRVIVPDIEKVWRECNDRYLGLLKEGLKTWWPSANFKQPTDTPTSKDAVETLIFCHGHQSVYTKGLLATLMEVAGFKTNPSKYAFDSGSVRYGHSPNPELDGIDGHWKYMQLENCVLESCVVEGTKNDR